MTDPILAIIILCALVTTLIILVPILDAIPALTRFVSFRWVCVSIVLVLMVGVIIDFKELSDSTRDLTITGGMIIVGGFLLLKTLEKILYNGWLKGVNLKGSIEKGNLKGNVEISSDSKKQDETSQSN